MEFRIVSYLTEAGRSPVREYLEGIEREDERFEAAVAEAIDRMRDSHYHRRPFSESVGDGLFTIRATGHRQSRIFFYYRRGRRIILLHGFTKTTQQLPRKEIEIARRRMRDHMRRFPDEQRGR